MRANETITKVFYSSKFLKAIKKAPSEIQRAFLSKEKLFLSNCFDAKLKTHKLHGKYKDYWAFFINSSWRVMFSFLSETEVGFINLGTHDIYE